MLMVVPTPGVEVERLVAQGRTFALGTIPASGSTTPAFTLPAAPPRGFTFAAQAEVVGSNGLRRTNSTPIVVR